MTDFVDPQEGLRRRHQPRLFQSSENNGNIPPQDGNTIIDAIVPQDDSTTATVGNTDATMIGPQQPPISLSRTPPIPPPTTVNDNSNGNTRLGASSSGVASRWYCLLSTVFMLLAIVVAPPSSHSSLSSEVVVDQPHKTGNLSMFSVEEASLQAANGQAPRKGNHGGATTTGQEHHQRNRDQNKVTSDDYDFWSSWIEPFYYSWWQESILDEPKGDKKAKLERESNERKTRQPGTEPNGNKPWWARFGKTQSSDQRADSLKNDHQSRMQTFSTMVFERVPEAMQDIFRKWIDPALLHPTSTTTTDIIDKVLKSTPRLLTIANFMLAMTYLLHSAVAVWFLGPQHHHQGYSMNNRNNAAPNQQQNLPPGMVVDWSTSSNGARERMGGFLVFKLLLISAVVAPDTLDLLILLTWYTWLSCLRSLDHLAHTTTTHLAALGHPPRTGAVQLLFLVLACDIMAAAFCVALFHAAGLDMVLLLTCDCALLAADTLSHILKFLQCILDDAHTTTIRGMEARQLELHNELHNSSGRVDQPLTEVESFSNLDHSLHADSFQEGRRQRTASSMTPTEVQQESRRLDRRMEKMELAHSRRLSILDSVVFVLEMICHLLTIAHFCHIWSLHGIQFTLIDGVLALHLHSAVSTACKKVAQRRNVHSIAQELQGQFPNATDDELKKASATGDVCCICLGTMSSGGHVKKVKCGHLYHTHCLREIVERAQSLHAAKCPLCRASLLDGRNSTYPENRGTAPRNPPGTVAPPLVQPDQNNNNNLDIQMQRGLQVNDERALFRFSTETLLPAWLPIPAFSFEVVRRPPNVVQGPTPAAIGRLGDRDHPDVAAPQPAQNPRTPDNNETENPQPETQQGAPDTSFLRRLLVLAGAVPMSPEEEARALAQLVDMFPQYERSDLLRELRARGSAEAVAEAVLVGVFSGVPRGE